MDRNSNAHVLLPPRSLLNPPLIVACQLLFVCSLMASTASLPDTLTPVRGHVKLADKRSQSPLVAVRGGGNKKESSRETAIMLKRTGKTLLSAGVALSICGVYEVTEGAVLGYMARSAGSSWGGVAGILVKTSVHGLMVRSISDGYTCMVGVLCLHVSDDQVITPLEHT